VQADSAGTNGRLPPGPKISRLAALTYSFRRDPIRFLTALAAYGDLASYRMGDELFFFVNHPRYVRDILVTHQKNFTKSRGLERARRLLGSGLLTSEGDFHLRQRRLMQPPFHRERIAIYADTMVSYADRMRRSWSEGAAFDVAEAMSGLTLSIVGKTLLDVDVGSQAAEVGAALTDVMRSFWLTMLPFADAIERLPFGRMHRGRLARERLDRIIYGMIADRRSRAREGGDLLSMLLAARDEEDGSAMTDRQIRDEAMTIFLAGHETTANALTWTWYLLSQSPEVEARLRDEVRGALGSRLPTMADVASLPFVEKVVTESMRLYPPAWMIGRRAIEPYTIDGFTAPARTIFVMSQWVMHRDGRFFADPLRFNPDRWSNEFKAALPKMAYFPFGGGPRNCIGEAFAWIELVLLVATISQQWSLRLVPGHPVVPQPLVTLRTRHGMKMTAVRV